MAQVRRFMGTYLLLHSSRALGWNDKDEQIRYKEGHIDWATFRWCERHWWNQGWNSEHYQGYLEPIALPRQRSQALQGCHVTRWARHWQDVAGEGDRRRGWLQLHFLLGFRLRRDVCGHGCTTCQVAFRRGTQTIALPDLYWRNWQRAFRLATHRTGWE